MSLYTALINELARHQGRDRGIRCADLARLLGTTEREVRKNIVAARRQGVAICARPETGYFLAITPDELRESCKFLHDRAMSSLVQASQMQRISLPELLGQLFINVA